jgi:hypothetical protein
MRLGYVRIEEEEPSGNCSRKLLPPKATLRTVILRLGCSLCSFSTIEGSRGRYWRITRCSSLFVTSPPMIVDVSVESRLIVESSMNEDLRVENCIELKDPEITKVFQAVAFELPKPNKKSRGSYELAS